MSVRYRAILACCLLGLDALVGGAHALGRGSSQRLASRLKSTTLSTALSEIVQHLSEDWRRQPLLSFDRLAVREVIVSNNLPQAYGGYAEALVLESIAAAGKRTVIKCEVCRARQAQQINKKLIVVNVSNNLVQLDEAARVLNIDYFVDILLMGQDDRLVLAVTVISARTKEKLWTRSYDGESHEDKVLRSGQELRDIAKARLGDRYRPDYQTWYGMGLAGIPNIAGGQADAQALAFEFRGTEKLRSSDAQVGARLILYQTFGGIAPSKQATTPVGEEADEFEVLRDLPKPFETALGVQVIGFKNLVGDGTQSNRFRAGINAAAGPFLTVGYGTLFTRLGIDLYLSPKFAVGSGITYLAPTTIKLNNQAYQAKGGIGAEISLAVYL